MMKTLLCILLLAACAFGQPPAAVYPNRVPGWQDMALASNLEQSNLREPITSATSAIKITSSASFVNNSLVTIDDEIILVCTVSANVLYVCPGGRGFDHSVAIGHSSGSKVQGLVVAYHHNRLATELMSALTALGPNLINVAPAVHTHPFSQITGQAQNGQIAPGLDASKLGAGTVNNTKFGYLSNLTGDIQAQLNAIISSGGGFHTHTATGDVVGTVSGPLTVAFVGGIPASTVGSGAQDSANATSLNSASRIVKRDASGSFSANVITGSLFIGALTGNADTATRFRNAPTACTFPAFAKGVDVNGNAICDTPAGGGGGGAVGSVFGRVGAVVSATGDYSFSQISGSVADNQLASPADTAATAGAIAKRDGSGNLSGSILGNAVGFTGTLSGDVTGTQGATVVNSIAGRVFDFTGLADGKIMKWTASSSKFTVQDDLVGTGGGVLSFNGRTGNVLPASGDYSFSQLTGSATNAQLATGIDAAKISSGAVTNTIFGYLSNVTSDLQAQLNNKAALVHGHTLTGDVTGNTGASVVSTVGGVAATVIAAGSSAANSATDLNTAGSIVKRDASGNFAAGTITGTRFVGAVTGTVTGNVTGSAGTFTGSLTGDVTSSGMVTTVANVGGVSASTIGSSISLVANATNLATAGTIVKRDGSGNASFAAVNATTFNGALVGNASTASSVAYSGLTGLPVFATGAVTGRVRVADLGCSTGYASTCDANGNGLVDVADSATSYTGPITNGQLPSTIAVTGTIDSVGGFQMGGNTVIDSGGGWHRSYGATGWFNQTYGGGVYMTDTASVKVYGSKKLQADNTIVSTAGGFQFPDNSTLATAATQAQWTYYDPSTALGATTINAVFLADAKQYTTQTVSCQSDTGDAVIMLTKTASGTTTNILAANLTCGTSTASSTASVTLPVGSQINFQYVSGTAKRINVSVKMLQQ